MDKFELGALLFGQPRKESGIQTKPNAASIIYGTAMSDSVDGLVTVYVSGETVECKTICTVKTGDEVSILISGHRPVVNGVVGGGDRTQGEIDGIVPSGQYSLDLNTVMVEKYITTPSNIYVPDSVIATSWSFIGGVKTAYPVKLVLEATTDGTTYTVVRTESSSSSITVTVASIISSVPSAVGIRVSSFNIETGVVIVRSLAAIVEKSEEYITSNASGTYLHVTPGAENYSTGSNMRLSSSGLQIRNNSSELASFSGNTINLGSSGSSSNINLLGGRGKIFVNTSIFPGLTLSGQSGVLMRHDGSGVKAQLSVYATDSSNAEIDLQSYSTSSALDWCGLTVRTRGIYMDGPTSHILLINQQIQPVLISSGTVVESSGTISWSRYSNGDVIMKGRLIDTVTFSWVSGLGLQETSKAAPRFKFPFTFKAIPTEFCTVRGNANRALTGAGIGMMQENYAFPTANINSYSGQFYGVRGNGGPTGYLVADWYVIGRDF